MSHEGPSMKPLPRAEVVKAVERRNPCRIPLVHAKWWGQGLGDQHGERLGELSVYPEDTAKLWLSPLDCSAMGLSWTWSGDGAHDSRCVIDDWHKLDEFIEKMPDPAGSVEYDALIEQATQAQEHDLYVQFGWWGFLFERPWGLRGMANLMVDYYENGESLHRLHDALCTLYCGHIRTAAARLRPDGFWTSDDLGHQTQSMMSPEIFHEFLYPYYKRVGDTLRDVGMHFWLHSCGNNTELMEDLVSGGVDVFHPVQKHTMDERAVAAAFGDRMTFLAGIDVQHTLQEKDPDGVREEVRFLIDTFDRPEGGMCLGAGNGIVNGTPFENIRAFLDEAVTYGAEHRQRMG